MKQVNLEPTAKIAIKKNVLKTYEVGESKTVYLKDGTEFEIELFNPTVDTLLAKISLNGKLINGQGLVLRPGERVFLERYLDEDKKFKFTTYEVDDTEEVNNAIQNNGDVSIYFHKQVSYRAYNVINTNWDTGYYYYYGSITTGDTSYATPTIEVTYTSTSAGTPDKKETGIIEKGNKSKQNFTEIDMEFAAFHSYVSNIKILPEGEKIYTSEDLKYKKYCSNCGSKVKPNDKYCSKCGNKL